ncbi:PH domain-containing protein [Natrinema limicola]|uniref:Membrane-flanked domain protein n=1 Tax=Natrinema limicola JCM 13563 TaxID=1230457 RepID=M0BXC2_9EURY|nr:PH domain-containing protein [Natrinema limicola]ELZ15681.1 membrane-flanked domain protein [Natrinema limicola JCM 13563]
MSESSVTDSKIDDWLTLDQDEEIIWSGNPHGSSLIPALIIGLPLALVLVGLFIIAGAYLHRENTQYVVTTDGLYKKTGIISRDVQRIDFGKVQNTSYSQGFFGSQFGYGNVDVSTAGGSGIEMQFQSVPEPREVQELINKRVKASRGESRESGETKRDVLDEILIELKEIRTTLETQQGSVGDTAATMTNVGSSEERHSNNETDSELNKSERNKQPTDTSETDQGPSR